MIREDINQVKYALIWKLSPFQPNYWETLFKYTRAFFYGMDRQKLITELDTKIKVGVEDKMGTPIHFVLMVYENLPCLNSFTKSRNPSWENMYIYKYTIREWLTEIEDWIYQKLTEIEPEIRFTRMRELG